LGIKKLQSSDGGINAISLHLQVGDKLPYIGHIAIIHREDATQWRPSGELRCRLTGQPTTISQQLTTMLTPS
jgi:hypothetical protein